MSYLFIFGLFLLIPITLAWGKSFSHWIIPGFIVSILLFGMIKKVEIYQSFVEGAKGGFELAIKIIPYLVAILIAIGMFRASGIFDIIIDVIGPYTSLIGLPPEALPMVLMRPLSGSGSFGVLTDVLKDPTLGPDSYVGYLVSTIMGSTETTFYVLAVYFGAVQIRRIRHALAVGLITDIAGIAASILAVKLFLR
jgi:spore maturation protein SpmB